MVPRGDFMLIGGGRKCAAVSPWSLEPQQPCGVLPADELALRLADRRSLDEARSLEAVFQRVVDREHDALGSKCCNRACEGLRLTGTRRGGVDVAAHVVGGHPLELDLGPIDLEAA